MNIILRNDIKKKLIQPIGTAAPIPHSTYHISGKCVMKLGSWILSMIVYYN